MKPKHQRLILILLGIFSLSVGVGVMLRYFNEQLIFYYSPAQLHAGHVKEGKVIRIGGLVKEQSVIHHEMSNTVEFVITDGEQDVLIKYKGLLPNLFREGQGMVAQGQMDSTGVFLASSLLAKHDENYMPPEVAKTLKEKGHWKPNN